MPTVLVTGSTSGIGRETALELARLGMHVIVHGRDVTGRYFVDEELRESSALSYDVELRHRFWAECERMTGAPVST